MMVLPTKRELDLLEIIDDKSYSKEERKKAGIRVRLLMTSGCIE